MKFIQVLNVSNSKHFINIEYITDITVGDGDVTIITTTNSTIRTAENLGKVLKKINDESEKKPLI